MTAVSPAPTRSGLHKFLLLVLTVAAVATLLAEVSVWHRMLVLFPNWAAFTFLAIAVLRLLSVAAIWRWSRAGVVTYLLLATGSAPVNAVVGTWWTGILGIVGALVLVAIVWPTWKHMP